MFNLKQEMEQMSKIASDENEKVKQTAKDKSCCLKELAELKKEGA